MVPYRSELEPEPFDSLLGIGFRPQSLDGLLSAYALRVEEEEEEHLLTLGPESIWSILRNATDLRRTEKPYLYRGTGIEVGTGRQFNIPDTFVSLSFRSFRKS